MMEIFDKIGSFGTLLLTMGGVTFLLMLLFAAASVMQRRVPVVAWWAFPIVVAVMGAIGTWMASGDALVYAFLAPAEQSANIAFAGLWDAIRVDWLGRWIAAGCLVVGCWGAALGAGLAAGPDKLWTWGAAVMCLALTVLGTAVGVYYAVNNDLGTEAYVLIGLMAFGGLGVAFSATRRALHEHEYRVAGMRFAAASCYFLSVLFAARATVIGSRLHVFSDDALALGQLELADAIAAWNTFALPVDGIHWIVICFAAAIAWFGFVNELGEIVMRYTLLDVMASTVLLVLLGTVFFIQSTGTGPLFAIGTHGPALTIYEEMGAELPAAVVSVEKQIYEVSLSNSTFGDVFVYRASEVPSAQQAGTVTSVAFSAGAKVNRGDVVAVITPKDPSMGKPMEVVAQLPGVVSEVMVNQNDAVEKNVALMKIETGWIRRFRRTAIGWSDDDTLLADVELSANPLLAIGAGADAAPVVELLEKVPENKALLLMRSAEVKADVEVPADLAQRQVTFLPIQLSGERDLKTEAWTVAGERSINWGPVVWFGDNMEEEPMVYSPTVFEQTQATGLHVLVGETARVKGVLASCMPVRVDRKNPDGSDIVFVVPDPEEGEEGAQAADEAPSAEAAEAAAPAAPAAPAVASGEEEEKTAWQFSTSNRFCHLSGADEKEFIDDALAVWEVPTTNSFSMGVTTKGPLELGEAQGLIERQIGAFEWCIDEAREVAGSSPETTAGRMTLNGKVRKSGEVSSVSLDERSKLNNGTIAACVGKRLKTIAFSEIPEPEETEGKEEQEPAEAREFQIILNIRAEAS